MSEQDETALESSAAAVRSSTGSMPDLVRAFLATELVVPTAGDPKTEQFSPVLTDIDGVVHMVVASRPACLAAVRDVARFAISLGGAQVVAGLQRGFGVAVHVPHGVFTLSPEVLAAARDGRLWGASGDAD